MNYAQAEQTLKSALKFGIDPSLEPIRALCAELGNPQRAFACVQIAGTNGKTSTARMTAALLRAAGLRVGLYTSPELMFYPERMEIDGQVASEEQFAAAIEAAAAAGERAGLENVTEFELLTAGALRLFAEEGVQVAVLECGLGGRWDATSVCDPSVAVITGIGLDHTHILGNTLEEIAAEKAAIIKPGCTAVLAANLNAYEVFKVQITRAAANCVDLTAQTTYAARAAKLATQLEHLPHYQALNIPAALAATEALLGEEISDQTAATALQALRIPGRFEILARKPLQIIDAAHNPQSATLLAEEIKRQGLTDLTLVLGVLADKDAYGIVQVLAPLFKNIVVTKSTSDRALAPEDLAQLVEQACNTKPRITQSIQEAKQLLQNEPFIATGSITVAGQLKACGW